MYDVAIIGCGVIGASLAYTLSRYDLRVLVLERENDVAMGTTKANSAIVHAGYDPEPGTLMAKLNVQGSAMMEQLCADLSVEYKRIGSLVLGFSEEDRKTLGRIYENGVQNGVPGLEMLTGEQARGMEPALSADVIAALYAPSAAVIDPWGLCIAEAEVAVRNGAKLRLRSEVTGLAEHGDFCTISTTTGTYEARYVVNCAGVDAETVYRMTEEPKFKTLPSRGAYYLLDKSSGDLVSHVVFQCPSAAGKGVLVAPTVHGNLIVGPNAEEVRSSTDRAVTAAALDAVATAAKKSVPGVDLRQSIRNFAGVRANTTLSDFYISPTSPRVLHAAGIKSPGLSAAPAIAEYAAEQLAAMGLALNPREGFDGTRRVHRFRRCTAEEKAALVRENPLYGRVICRCETITEGEIVDAIHSPIPPCSIDGIKRRAGAGMGRCQGGFCGPRVLEILARELGVPQKKILQDQDGTFLITGETKTGGAHA